MRTRSLMLLVLLVTLSGCETYRDFPIVNPLPSPYEPAAPPRCHQTIKFPGGPAKQSPWSKTNLSVLLQEALKDYGGCGSSSPVDYNSKGAETEVVVSVLNKISHPIWYEISLGLVFIVSGGLVPVYRWQDGWELSYGVYDRSVLKKMYNHELTSKRLIWIVLLPFSWINFFTYSLEDAVQQLPLPGNLLTATSNEAGRLLSAYVMEVVKSTFRSFRIVLIPLRSLLLVNCGGSKKSCVLTQQDAARDFSGCNFVDASIVGCV